MTDTLKELKDELAETCQKAFRRGLVGGAGGNISVRVPGRTEALITATGVSLGDIAPETIVLVNLEGRLLDGAPGMRPSKETGFHVCAYRLRPHVGAVVHLHPPHATAFAVRGLELPLVTDGAMLNLKHVPVVGHAPSGSPELHRIVEEGLRTHPEAKAILLERHGMFSMGPNLTVAFNLADLVEDTAKIAILSQLIRS
ncbi:MAG TPA: class II aldolase/adducin family protein [Candidatus Methylomirabilis sp.]|jgi:L-fuculose-phosphate aldolase